MAWTSGAGSLYVLGWEGGLAWAVLVDEYGQYSIQRGGRQPDFTHLDIAGVTPAAGRLSLPQA